jgi:hypothetical protein
LPSARSFPALARMATSSVEQFRSFRVNLACVPLVCSFRRAEIAPAPAPDFQPTGLTP